MKIFSPLYNWAMNAARHPKAPWILAVLSFAESSFFPIPPDVMLAPMCLANPKRAWALAALTALMSVLGGLAGYAIGAFAFEMIRPYLEQSSYWEDYQKIMGWFDAWGFWAIFVAGFSPIPYKLFTIAAGTLSMALTPFVIASAIGRSSRFFLVAGLMFWGGEKMEASLRTHIDRLGWACVALVVVGGIAYRFLA